MDRVFLRRGAWRRSLVSILVLLIVAGSAIPAMAGSTTRVSVDSAGREANGENFGPSISYDGRFVAFASFASNLVPGDTNGVVDIFVHDRSAGITTRVSVNSAGGQGNGGSWGPSISADGRFVAFTSYAKNLVPGDTNGTSDIFVHDRQTGVTSRVSGGLTGSEANSGSKYPRISGDGRFVSFLSTASNLVAGDRNEFMDVFVHDRQTGVTRRVSVDSAGRETNLKSYSPLISADGRFVAFQSGATNLVPGDTNRASDVFVHDRQTGVTTRVPPVTDCFVVCWSGYPSISADGRFVAFVWESPTNDEIYVHDRQTGVTTRVSDAPESYAPSISADGRFVAFESGLGRSDVFVRDLLNEVTTRVSVDSAGGQANGSSDGPSISATGRFVAFSSEATNLVPGDTNGFVDIFVHDLN